MSQEIEFDYIIIGAGILGSACAYSMSRKLETLGKRNRIAVLDLDLEGEFSSTLKNAGGVRATWRNEANIQLCNYSIGFYESIGKEIDLKQTGYYWLHNEQTWEEMNKNYPLYKEYGLEIELFNASRVKDYLPFIDNLEGISGLSISKKAGLIDHYSLRQFYRKSARNYGVEFHDNRYIYEIELDDRNVKSIIAMDINNNVKKEGNEYVRRVLKNEGTVEESKRITYRCKILINAVGAWSSKISELYGYKEDDIKPRRRQVELISCPDIDLKDYGMIIDTSDIYFHKEGENILVGYSNMDEPYGVNFSFDFYSLKEGSPFIELIWKPLWKRISKFEKLKFITGWAGVYGETTDRSGYLGKVPGLENVYECAGHTGRGLMISYGAGEAMADIIIDGKLRDELRNANDFLRSRPNGPLYEQLHL